MVIRYRYIPQVGSANINNIPPECAPCSGGCNSKNELHKCPCTNEYVRRGKTLTEHGELYVCTNQEIRASKLFKRTQRMMSEILGIAIQAQHSVIENARDDVHRLLHNLETLNGQTLQAIHRVFPQDIFSQPDRESLLAAVSEKITSKGEEVQRLIINLQKNTKLEKSEFAVYRKLVESEDVEFRSFSIHKLLLLVLNTYWDAFGEKAVSIRIGECYANVRVDYDTFVAALVLLLDNAVKYIFPNSQFRIEFVMSPLCVDLVLNMVSLRIHPDEQERIFDEGVSGIEPTKLQRNGEGRGLYLARRLLKLSDSELALELDVNTNLRARGTGVEFENNLFKITVPRVTRTEV